MCSCLIFLWHYSLNRALTVSFLRALHHTIRARTDTHTPGRFPLYEWSARSRGRYLHNTRTHKKHVLSNRTAADLRLSPIALWRIDKLNNFAICQHEGWWYWWPKQGDVINTNSKMLVQGEIYLLFLLSW